MPEIKSERRLSQDSQNKLIGYVEERIAESFREQPRCSNSIN